uniref:RNA-dependent RNA polymerase n=1 Tax=Rabbit picobirnavirus 7 TaxID=2716681 RepID=A0A6G7PSF0_9VIRU|nr:RNA-dependent RNA polymerase [Rabbit picobirnavirus 7]
MEKKQPDLGNFFKLPNPGLRAYFQHTVQGNQDDYRPPFWKGQPREEVLSKWQKVFDGLGVQKKWPTLYEYEMEMKAKVGPMSIQLPLKDRLESIEDYFKRVEGKHDPLPQAAIDATISYFGKAKGVRLRSLANTAANMRLSTNSGNPWFTKRRRVIQEAISSQVIRESGKWYGVINGQRYELAAILGWRGQEGGISDDDVKQRVIWMMSVLLNLHELSFYQPAIEAMQKTRLIPAYVSMDEVDRQVTALFDTKGANDVVICTDFSKFDQSFNSEMQSAALAVERALATPTGDSEMWFEKIYPAKFNIPLICDESLMYEGFHGMGSGSGGTNFDECMAHKCLQFDACQRINTQLNPHSMAYGDDGVLTAPNLRVEDVMSAYTSHGMEMNPEKQYVSTHDCVVLRRWHHIDYRIGNVMVGVYSTFRALGRLLAQERFYDPEEWGPEQVTLRAWSILENCNNSPYFEEFVNFVLTGDKYRLGLDLPGFMDRVVSIAKNSIDQLPDFLGYTKTLQDKDPSRGITSWRIFKYLSKLK